MDQVTSGVSRFGDVGNYLIRSPSRCGMRKQRNQSADEFDVLRLSQRNLVNPGLALIFYRAK
jgi:hypothetical protein